MSLAEGDQAVACLADSVAEDSVAASIRARASALAAVANDLMALAAEIGPISSRAGEHADESLEIGKLARRAYRERRMRAQVFADSALFGEPAWDLLLDLFIAAREGKKVPVSSACIGAAVPNTTALRWLAQLEERGLIQRENDASDARRVFVRLSDHAEQQMTDYFARLVLARQGETAPATPPRMASDASATPFMLGK